MGRHLKTAIWLGIMAVVLGACGTTQEARQEDKRLEDFKLSLAERQVARRRQTAEVCHRRGVALPAQYQQKGGGILEDYVPSRPPCGISARQRIDSAEADFRETWQAVMGEPVPVPYEWLLAAKRRIEAQWVVSESEARALPAAAESGQSSGTTEQTFTRLNTALNQALAEHGIACRDKGGSQPCF
jgi:hypothetical protein